MAITNDLEFLDQSNYVNSPVRGKIPTEREPRRRGGHITLFIPGRSRRKLSVPGRPGPGVIVTGTTAGVT